MKRVITGVCYVLVIGVFFALKVIFNNDVFFDVLIYAFSLLGTNEMLRAFEGKSKRDIERGIENKTHIILPQKICVWVFAALFTPIYVIFELLISQGIALCVFLTIAQVLVLLLLHLIYGARSSSTLSAFICSVYPTALLVFLLAINHLANLSTFAILFIFIVTPCADVLAYFFGITLGKKFPKKLASSISPQKTMIGGLGGLIGGALAAMLVYIVYCAVVPDFSMFVANSVLDEFLVVAFGLVSAVVTEVGDLLESYIKRRLEIKDMGKLLPGHGGVLDRIDGTLLTAIFVYFVFVIISLAA